ncbi:uncharacterized protein LOC100370027 [Saccoglossus kowalevskii]
MISFKYVVFLSCCISVQCDESSRYDQLTDAKQVKEALVDGYPVKFFVDFEKCETTKIPIAIPEVDLQPPSQYGSIITEFRATQDVTGEPVDMRFTTTNIMQFPGVLEHIYVHTEVVLYPTGNVTVNTHYIQRKGLVNAGTSENDCLLNDGTNDEGAFFYKSTLYEPVAMTTYDEIESALVDGYSVRYGVVFTRCGDFGGSSDMLGAGDMPQYYITRGEQISTATRRFAANPTLNGEFVLDTFRVDIFKNATVKLSVASLDFDDFSSVRDEEVLCSLEDPASDPPASIFKLVPRVDEQSTAPDSPYLSQLVTSTQIGEALSEGYPMQFFVNFENCDRDLVVTPPEISLEEPTDFGTIIDEFRGTRDVTGMAVQLQFTATKVAKFRGVDDPVIVHVSVVTNPSGAVSVAVHYISQANYTSFGVSNNICQLNDGTSGGGGAFFYRSTLYEPEPLQSFKNIQTAVTDQYNVRYGGSFSRCDEVFSGAETLSSGFMKVFYILKDQRITASINKLYQNPYYNGGYVQDVFRGDIFSNDTMHASLQTLDIDNFFQRITDVNVECPINDPPNDPPTKIFQMVPRKNALQTTAGAVTVTVTETAGTTKQPKTETSRSSLTKSSFIVTSIVLLVFFF